MNNLNPQPNAAQENCFHLFILNEAIKSPIKNRHAYFPETSMLLKIERRLHSPFSVEELIQRAKMHLAMRDFTCVDEGPPMEFCRGSFKGNLFSMSASKLPHSICIHYAPDEIGAQVNITYQVNTWMTLVIDEDKKFWLVEVDDLEKALAEEVTLPIISCADKIARISGKLKTGALAVVLAAGGATTIFLARIGSKVLARLSPYIGEKAVYPVHLTLSLIAFGACLYAGYRLVKWSLAPSERKGCEQGQSE